MVDDTKNRRSAAEIALEFNDQNGSGQIPPEMRQVPLRAIDGERHKLVFKWNRTQTKYPVGSGVHQLFEKQVECSPNSIAIVFADEELSYAELNRRANQLAELLRAKGVGRNALVGIHVGRSPEFVIAILGILKAGGAYVPLDLEYPADRLDFMTADAETKVLVCGPDLAGQFNCEHRDMITLPLPAIDLEVPIENPVCVNAPEDLAYVMYTSGSTGRPKGVCMPHRQLLNLIHWQNSQSRCGKEGRTLQFAPLGFDVCFQEIFSTLAWGGTLVIPETKERKDFEKLLRLIEETEINRLFLPFVALEHLAEVVEHFGRALTCVSEVITAGEQLRVTPAIRRLFQKLKGARLINQYGPTEAHVVSAYELSGDPADWPFWPSIGKPIANTQRYILDSELEPVPVGVVGDLYIGGVQVAQGYLKRPELTTEKFIPDLFSRRAEARLYRTDDSAKYLPDGNIEFLGRTDDQVKVRGFRVELGEIEAVLCEHPGVRQCVVVAPEDSFGGRILTAYFRSSRKAAPATDELREFLKLKLPDYMIPATFTALTEFPLTPNGKVDRRALPLPDLEPGTECSPTEKEIERKLAEILGASLQQRVGLHDNFFELGGHSLLAVRLVAQINKVFAARLDALTFYQHPTVHELAELLQAPELFSHGARFICLRRGEGGSPVIFLNPPLEFVRTVKLVNDRTSFYASEVHFSQEVGDAALRFDTSAYPTLSEMIDPHVAIIRESGLSGPIFLSGYSSHGVVAFEVARKLLQAGMKIGGVFLFDADTKTPPWEVFKVLCRRHSRNLKVHGLAYLWEKARGRIARISQDPRTAVEPRDRDTPIASLSNGEISWRVFQRVWDHLLRNYRPSPLLTRGVLFRAATNIYSDIPDYDGCLGWRDLFLNGLEVVEVPGDHVSMWKEPDVLALSRSWRDSLRRLDQPANAPGL